MIKHPYLRRSLVALLALTAFAGTGAMAQTNVPHHPRVNEVNHRIEHQQQRIDKGLANGTVTPRQAARDQAHAANIARRTSADEARHNGHLTRRETHRLNRAENRNSRHIRKQRRH